MDKPSILIIDDAPGTGGYLLEVLSGYAPRLAGSGAEGLALLEQVAPDLVLLSASLADTDGFELCRKIKTGSDNRELPLIFVSSQNDPKDKIKGLESGAGDFLSEPFDPGEILARVRTQLELHRLTRRLRQANENLSSALVEIRKQNRTLKIELEAAAAVQRALLPGPARDIPNLSLEWRLSPSASVAGDLLDWFVLDKSRIGFYLADVSGHGAASGLIAASIHQALTPRADQSSLVRALVADGGEWAPSAPVEIAGELEKIFPYDRFEKYFTMVYGVLNHRTGVLSYLTAGHPRPLVVGEQGGFRELETTGPPIGLKAGEFDQAETILEPGDRLFIYSDGITEAEGENGFYGRERLRDSLGSGRGANLSASLDLVLADLSRFCGGNDLLDDVACLGLELGREQGRLF